MEDRSTVASFKPVKPMMSDSIRRLIARGYPGITAAIVAATLLPACLASQPTGPSVVAETASERLEDLTVGEYLWMVRVVEKEQLYSTGHVVKSSRSDLYLCTRDSGLGAACRLAQFPRSDSAQRHSAPRPESTSGRDPDQTTLADFVPGPSLALGNPKNVVAAKFTLKGWVGSQVIVYMQGDITFLGELREVSGWTMTIAVDAPGGVVAKEIEMSDAQAVAQLQRRVSPAH